MDSDQIGACDHFGCGVPVSVGILVGSAVVRCAAWLRHVQRWTMYKVTAALGCLYVHLPRKPWIHRDFSHVVCSWFCVLWPHLTWTRATLIAMQPTPNWWWRIWCSRCPRGPCPD